MPPELRLQREDDAAETLRSADGTWYDGSWLDVREVAHIPSEVFDGIIIVEGISEWGQDVWQRFQTKPPNILSGERSRRSPCVGFFLPCIGVGAQPRPCCRTQAKVGCDEVSCASESSRKALQMLLGGSQATRLNSGNDGLSNAHPAG